MLLRLARAMQPDHLYSFKCPAVCSFARSSFPFAHLPHHALACPLSKDPHPGNLMLTEEIPDVVLRWFFGVSTMDWRDPERCRGFFLL